MPTGCSTLACTQVVLLLQPASEMLQPEPVIFMSSCVCELGAAVAANCTYVVLHTLHLFPNNLTHQLATPRFGSLHGCSRLSVLSSGADGRSLPDAVDAGGCSVCWGTVCIKAMQLLVTA